MRGFRVCCARIFLCFWGVSGRVLSTCVDVLGVVVAGFWVGWVGGWVPLGVLCAYFPRVIID